MARAMIALLLLAFVATASASEASARLRTSQTSLGEPTVQAWDDPRFALASGTALRSGELRRVFRRLLFGASF